MITIINKTGQTIYYYYYYIDDPEEIGCGHIDEKASIGQNGNRKLEVYCLIPDKCVIVQESTQIGLDQFSQMPDSAKKDWNSAIKQYESGQASSYLFMDGMLKIQGKDKVNIVRKQYEQRLAFRGGSRTNVVVAILVICVIILAIWLLYYISYKIYLGLS